MLYQYEALALASASLFCVLRKIIKRSASMLASTVTAGLSFSVAFSLTLSLFSFSLGKRGAGEETLALSSFSFTATVRHRCQNDAPS